MARSTAPEGEAEYECKHCDATTNELKAEECNEASLGFHSWQPVDPSDRAGTDAYEIHNSEEEEENDDWKTMSSEECKRQAGFEQVDGIVYEKTETTDEEAQEDYWNPGGSSCPNCGAGSEMQTIKATPSQSSSVERSLPDRVYDCESCGIQWES